MLRLCQTLYAVLIRLYPPAFRATFGPELHAVFCAKLAEARLAGRRAMLAVWLQELIAWPANLLREYWYCLNRHVSLANPWLPLQPWKKVLLASLPGALAVASVWWSKLAPDRSFFYAVGWAGVIGLLLLVVASLVKEQRLAAWSLPIWGYLFINCLGGFLLKSPYNAGSSLFAANNSLLANTLFTGMSLLVGAGGLAVFAALHRYWHRFSRWVWFLVVLMISLGVMDSWSIYGYGGLIYSAISILDMVILGILPTGLMLLWLMLGIPLARRYGIAAILFLLPSVVFYIEVLHPTHAMFYSPFFPEILRSILNLGLLIIIPLWVLRARSGQSQIEGILLLSFLVLLNVALFPALYFSQGQQQPGDFFSIFLRFFRGQLEPGDFFRTLMAWVPQVGQIFLGIVATISVYTGLPPGNRPAPRGIPIPAQAAVQKEPSPRGQADWLST